MQPQAIMMATTASVLDNLQQAHSSWGTCIKKRLYNQSDSFESISWINWPIALLYLHKVGLIEW